MSRKFKSSEDVGGESSGLKQPGTYHCTVVRAADGESTKGNPISGLSAILSVLDGTVPDQQEKEFHLHLFDPDMSKGESNQEWATKKQTAYGIAVNQIDPSKLGEEFEVDFGAVEGQQIIINLEANEYQGKTRLDLNYANIYHVDDPRAESFPKDKEALALLPAEMRRKPEYFSAIARKSTSPAVEPKSRISDDQLAGL